MASTVGRVCAFMLALVCVSALLRLGFAISVPWVFIAFMGGLALTAAAHGQDRAHLVRHPGGHSDHRPSRGCYPPGGSV